MFITIGRESMSSVQKSLIKEPQWPVKNPALWCPHQRLVIGNIMLMTEQHSTLIKDVTNSIVSIIAEKEKLWGALHFILYDPSIK